MDRDKAVKIATVALHRAMAGDLPGAASYVKRLDSTDGLIIAIMAWSDTFIGHLYPEHQPGQPVGVRWLNRPTGAVETADEVSPSLRWAGRIIAARAADDEAGFYALLRTPAGGSQLGDSIMALLHVVADSLANPDAVKGAVVPGG